MEAIKKSNWLIADISMDTKDIDFLIKAGVAVELIEKLD